MKTRFLIIALCLGGLASGESESLLDQAMAKLEKKDYVGALADLQRILEEPEPNPIVHYQIGVCQTLLGKYPEALDSFHRLGPRVSTVGNCGQVWEWPISIWEKIRDLVNISIGS